MPGGGPPDGVSDHESELWPVVELPPSRERPRRVRDHVRRALADWGCAEPDDVVLITSELASYPSDDSVRLRLLVGRAGRRLRVELHGPGTAVFTDMPEAGHFVLRVLDEATLAWGQSVTDDGPMVWAEFPC